MSKTLNKVTLIGNVGSEPTIRTTQSGTKVANLSIATNFQRANQDPEVSWHRVVAWDRLAEIVEEYVHTGDKLFVEGYISYGSYDKDGVTIPTTDIVVRELIMLSPKSDSQQSNGHPLYGG